MKTAPIVTHRHDVHAMIPETFQFLSQPRNIKCLPIQAKTSGLPLKVNVVTGCKYRFLKGNLQRTGSQEGVEIKKSCRARHGGTHL